MAGMAQGAVTSLLGRLTSVLVAEAQLLRRVRGDVEFIKDEMKSMNGLLRHLTEAQYRDHQVRAWMKQVISLARDCEGYVELYIRRVGVPREAGGASGLVGRLRRLLCLLRSIPERHEIGMRIRELKERARDVGDRRERYGVTVPPAAPPHGARGASRAALDHKLGGQEEEEDKKEEDLRRRELLRGDPPNLAEEATRKIRTWLLSSPDRFHWPSRRLALIVGRGSAGKTAIAKRVYLDASVESSFQHKVWVDVGGFDKDHNEVRREMIKQLMMTTRPAGAAQDAATGCAGSSKVDDDVQVQQQQPDCLRRALDQNQSRPPLPAGPVRSNKSLLIVLDAVRPADIEGLLSDLQSKVLHTVRDHTYAVIVTTKNDQGLGYLYSRRAMETRTWYGQVFDVHEPLRVFFRRKAVALVKSEFPPILSVLEECCPSTFALQMFLHLLYVDHNRSEEELDGLRAALRQHQGNIAKEMLVFCYNELPSSHKSCLLYLSIYPQGHRVRRTSLLRRWVAEGLITERLAAPSSTLEDQAERIFDALVARGFVRPVEMEMETIGGGTGKVKSCAVPDEVHEFIASDVGFMDASSSSSPDLAHRLSINCGIALLEASSSDILTVIESVSKSPQWQLLKVLDLEKCQGLMKKRKHLTSICKILLLKYLSLRDTDVTQLPNQIERLQCLETLDIRGTAIRSLCPARSVVLPMLKHMLAGRKDSAGNHCNSISDRSSDQLLFTTSIGLPSNIGRMRKLEMLCHVEVSSNINVLYGIGQLLQLRKLGVILNGNMKGSGLSLLFRQIGELCHCLRSLSVRIRSNGQLLKCDEGAPDAGVRAPEHLERLTITGLTMTSGLPSWLAHLTQLAKITLCETRFEEDDIHHSLGNLGMLRCLRLLRRSCTGTKLAFREGEFKCLRSLIVEGGDIADISFGPGAARNLEIIVWSSDKIMEAVSGLGHLPKLKEVQLINDDCDHLVKAIEKEVGSNPQISIYYKPRHQCQDSGTVVSASTSAP